MHVLYSNPQLYATFINCVNKHTSKLLSTRTTQLTTIFCYASDKYASHSTTNACFSLITHMHIHFFNNINGCKQHS